MMAGHKRNEITKCKELGEKMNTDTGKFVFFFLTFVNLPPSVYAVTTDNSKHSDSVHHMTIT